MITLILVYIFRSMYGDYIVPSNDKTKIDQGNVFENVMFDAVNAPFNAILITPICDLPEANFVHFISILDFNTYFEDLIKRKKTKLEDIIAEYEDKPNQNKFSSLNNYLNDFLGNNVNQYHWLGIIPNNEKYHFINYELVVCKPKSYLDQISKIAEIRSPIKESIFVKYAYYMARIGLPFEKKDVVSLRDKIVPEVAKQISDTKNTN